MASHWDWYMCTIHGHEAVVQVDLSFGQTAPLAGLETLCWVFVPLRDPELSGLATQRETPSLQALENELVPVLTQALAAAYVARATTHGRREFYFYANSADRLQETVRQVMTRFPEYGCDAGAQKDPAWSHFTTVLFPAPYELQLMHTRHEVDRLRKAGDGGSERPIRHFVYFTDWQARANYRAWAEQQGFACEEPPPESAGPVPQRPFRLVMSRVDRVDLALLSSLVAHLFDRATQAQGEYDGWEATVVAGGGTT